MTARAQGEHRLSGVAWTIVVAIVAVNAGAVALGVLDRHVQSFVATAIFTVVTLGFAGLGALIVWRERGHAIGWLFVGMAWFLSVPHNLAQNYAVYALVVEPGRWPAGPAAFWLSSSAFDVVFVMLMSLLLLLFPSGRPLTPRWRPAVAAAVVGGVLGVAGGLTDFTGSAALARVHNPLEASGDLAAAANAARALGVLLAAAAFIAGVASVALHFRRSTGVERQQVKWVSLGVLIVTAVFVVTQALALAGAGDLSGFTFVLAIVLFPVLMGVAILRYRLYDIDLVIRRTLLYACLVGVLGLLYAGGIAGLGALTRSLTGQSGAFAVTASTLVVALAFQPLRRRIQAAIDRRFARRSVDAEAAVRALSDRVREQVDLDALCAEMLGIVEHTFGPRHATLWLRGPERDA